MTSADDDDEEVEEGAGAGEPDFDFFIFEFMELDVVDPGPVAGVVGASIFPLGFLFFLFPIGRKKKRRRTTLGGWRGVLFFPITVYAVVYSDM